MRRPVSDTAVSLTTLLENDFMTITPFPSQGQYPWHDQLEQWGADIQSAAESAELNADDLRADVATALSDSTAASAAAIAAAGLVGAPAGEAVLAAISEGGAARGELESMIDPKLGRAEADATYAKKGDLPAGAVTSGQVVRIVAVLEGEPVPALAEGDLVVQYRLPGSIYYKDFSGDTAGVSPNLSPPTNMTQLLSGVANVREFSTGTGGKVLITPSSGTTAYALTEAQGDAFYEDAEFLVRWRTETSHGLNVFFNVDAASDSFYRIGYIATGAVRWTTRRNGVNASTPEVSIPVLPNNTWCMMRARMAGGVISGKVWVETDPEPTDWQYSRALADFPPLLPAGPHGVGSVDTQIRIDNITHATGGTVAVKP